MWCNVGFAEKYTLTCNTTKFLKVYSIDENTKTIILLSSRSLINNQVFNNLNQGLKIILWKNKIVNGFVMSSAGVSTYITFNLNKKILLQSGHYPYENEIYNQKFKCIVG